MVSTSYHSRKPTGAGPPPKAEQTGPRGKGRGTTLSREESGSRPYVLFDSDEVLVVFKPAHYQSEMAPDPEELAQLAAQKGGVAAAAAAALAAQQSTSRLCCVTK